MDLAERIIVSREYLSCFDYDHYPSCFQAFEAGCVPFFETLEAAGPEQAAVGLMEALERRRAALPGREQKLAAEEEKRVLALFLSPAAARWGGLAVSFAEELNRKWNARYPRNTYLVSTYEAIMKGFDSNLLGLPLRKSKRKG
ncbi:MAG: hypothetical protein IKQ69_00470 [Oscillospiraceae bacterium]|nr:hypothetical protein [Oscillospiraceae bacterium]